MLNLENMHDVTLAKDGQEAYNMTKYSMEKDTAYDLIFMDIQVSCAAPKQSFSNPII